MNNAYWNKLQPPKGKIDVVLDTDAYNEIDDQFAISYLLRAKDRANLLALYAAPFFNENSNGPKDGMEKSYDEILKLLALAGEKVDVFKGSETYLPDEKTPVLSPAAEDLVKKAQGYTEEKPLYVVAIGAITNVASALLIDPSIADKIVVVWLGGHSLDFHDTKEFNLWQDVAAARVILQSGAAFVQLPCFGVVSGFTVSGSDLRDWFMDKNPLSDYLARNTISAAESYAKGTSWTRVIWDAVAVAWLFNADSRFMQYRIEKKHLPSYSGQYELAPNEDFMTYVYYVNRDALWNDMIRVIAKEE